MDAEKIACGLLREIYGAEPGRASKRVQLIAAALTEARRAALEEARQVALQAVQANWAAPEVSHACARIAVQIRALAGNG